MKKYIFLLCTVFFFVACQEEVYTPKPRAFPKVNYPEKKYVKFDEGYCKFNFDYPAYAEVIQDTLFFNEKPIDPCWFDLYFPDFNAKLHCSYYPLNGEKDFEKLKQDAFRLAMEHKIKANFIDELPVDKSEDIKGFIFDIEGAVASPFQFYLSDNSTHFFRAALYVNSKAKADSLAPIYEFLKRDVVNIVQTFEWVEQ